MNRVHRSAQNWRSLRIALITLAILGVCAFALEMVMDERVLVRVALPEGETCVVSMGLHTFKLKNGQSESFHSWFHHYRVHASSPSWEIEQEFYTVDDSAQAVEIDLHRGFINVNGLKPASQLRTLRRPVGNALSPQ